MSNATRMVRLPMNQIGNLSKLYKLHNNLSQELEREPTEMELAECYKELSPEVIGELMALKKPVSVDAPISTEETGALSEIIPDDNVELPDKALMRESERQYIDYILNQLPEREKNILLLAYGINDENKEYTIEELSEHFGLTRERIRQIKGDALVKARTIALQHPEL